jgi:hypothetical protein
VLVERAAEVRNRVLLALHFDRKLIVDKSREALVERAPADAKLRKLVLRVRCVRKKAVRGVVRKRHGGGEEIGDLALGLQKRRARRNSVFRLSASSKSSFDMADAWRDSRSWIDPSS